MFTEDLKSQNLGVLACKVIDRCKSCSEFNDSSSRRSSRNNLGLEILETDIQANVAF